MDYVTKAVVISMIGFVATAAIGIVGLRFAPNLSLLIQARPIYTFYAAVFALAVAVADLIMISFLLSYYRQVDSS